MLKIIQKSIHDTEKGVCIIKELITEMSLGVFRNRNAVSIEESLTSDTPKYTFANLKALNSKLENKNVSEIFDLNSAKEFRKDFPGYKFLLTIFGSKKNPISKFRFAKYDEANAK